MMRLNSSMYCTLFKHLIYCEAENRKGYYKVIILVETLNPFI